MLSLSPPKHGPILELHRIACFPPSEQNTLNWFSSLLTKLKIKALGSVTQPPLECHFCSLKPPKILPLVAFMIARVFSIPSQCE